MILGRCPTQPTCPSRFPPLLPPAPADVAQAVVESESPDSPYLRGGAAAVPSPLGFYVPPPFAIAVSAAQPRRLALRLRISCLPC